MKSVSNGLGTNRLGKGGVYISSNLGSIFSFSSSDLLDDSQEGCGPVILDIGLVSWSGSKGS